MRDDFQNQLSKVEALLQEEKYDRRLTLEVIRTNRQLNRHSVSVPAEVVSLLEEESNLVATIQRLSSLIAKHTTIVSEAESEGPVTGDIKVEQNLTDITGDASFVRDMGHSDGPDIGQRHILDVSDFFSRPIHIDSFSIAAGSSAYAMYEIWDLYSKNPSVRAKLRNYAFLRGDLHVRIVVSGSPFYYGKALISYQPYGFYNKNLTVHTSAAATTSTWYPLFLNYLSQSKGCATIDYNGNKPVDMVCPFISPKPVHRLYASSNAVLAGASSYPDLAHAGQLYIYSINPVGAASATPTGVAVHLYAWMENVDLGPPTATQIEILTEAADERVKGPVERVSTFAALVANKLSYIPEIAPLARASSMILGGIAGVASWFGWSKPAILDEPRFVKNRPYANTACTIGQETVEKIAFDPKQELTVDGSVCASNHDEMTIAYLTGISSYLTTFDWATSASIDAPLWTCVVHPQLNTSVLYSTKYYNQPTAMSFAATPFRYWRGHIKYRVEISASRFHRGKLAIMYEPNTSQMGLIDASFELNKNFIKIVDIQETQDIEFCILYAQPYTWLKTLNCTDTRLLSMYGNITSGATDFPQIANGYVSVFPFTNLQSPDGSPVHVNIYVAAEEFQVNQMTASYLPSSRLIIAPESYDEKGIEPQTDYTCFELNASTDSGQGTSEYCFGEQPLSFRSCIKRYIPMGDEVLSIGAGTHGSIVGSFPIIPPADPPYGSSALHPLCIQTYLSYAYLGVKGGMRKRLKVFDMNGSGGNNDMQANMQFIVSLSAPGNSSVTISPAIAATKALPSEEGSAVFIPRTNGGVEVELPYYSPNLFQFSFANDFGASITDDSFSSTWGQLYNYTVDHTNPNVTVYVRESSAAAEDFTYIRYTGAPYYTNP